MKCESCGNKLKKGMILCPYCGVPITQEAEEEQPRKKLAWWKLALIIFAGVILLSVVVGAILYGLGVLKFENNILVKNSYTVSDKKAVRKADLVVAVAGSHTLTNEELQMYYTMEIAEFFSRYGSYLSSMGLDHTKPLDQQYISEEKTLTWQHLFIGNAINDWYAYAVMQQLAQSEGYTVSQEVQELIDSLPQQLQEMAIEGGYSSVEEMLREDFGATCTVNAYLSYLTDYHIVTDFMGSKSDPTMEEIKAYFAANQAKLEQDGIKQDGSKYVNVRHILIEPSGTEDESGKVTYTEEDWEACRQAAQAILDEWLAGEATESSFAELANKHSKDPGSNTIGGLCAGLKKGATVEEFDSWIFAEGREKGQYGLVKTKFGYHIIYYVDSEDIWVDQVREVIVTERVDAMLEEAQRLWPMEVTYRKIFLGNVNLVG